MQMKYLIKRIKTGCNSGMMFESYISLMNLSSSFNINQFIQNIKLFTNNKQIIYILRPKILTEIFFQDQSIH